MESEWEVLPFSEAVILNPATVLTKGAVYPFVEMAAVTSGTKDVHCLEHREFRGGGSRFRDRDTLMARITPCLENGKLARFRAPAGQLIGHGSTEFIVIRGRPSVTDNDFAYYLTISSDVRNHAISQMTGTSGRQRVPYDALSGINVLVPPLPTQRAIAKILGDLDDKIELHRKMNATLEAMARALFQSWFVDFDPVRAKLDGRKPAGLDPATAELFPDSFDETAAGHIPNGWKAATLGDIGTNSRRGVQPGDIAPHTPYIALEHMPRRCIALGDWDDSANVASGKSAFKKGEILFGKLRPYFHKVGVAPFDGVCSTDILVLAPKSPEWLGFLLGHASSDELIQFTDLASTGTKMPRTNWSDISSFKVALPPKPIAAAFTRNIQPMLDHIHANLHQSRTLATLRDTLLPKLLSGGMSVAAEQFYD